MVSGDPDLKPGRDLGFPYDSAFVSVLGAPGGNMVS